MEYVVRIGVDEEILRAVTLDEESSVEGLIEQEFGWLGESGIFLNGYIKREECKDA